MLSLNPLNGSRNWIQNKRKISSHDLDSFEKGFIISTCVVCTFTASLCLAAPFVIIGVTLWNINFILAGQILTFSGIALGVTSLLCSIAMALIGHGHTKYQRMIWRNLRLTGGTEVFPENEVSAAHQERYKHPLNRANNV